MNEEKSFELYSSTISEDALATTLRFHLLTEYYLEQIIKVSLPKGYKIVESNNFSYINKLNIIEALGSLDEKYIYSLKNLNKLRNKCSHQLMHEISENDVETIGSPLGKLWTKIKNSKGNKTSAHRLSHIFSHLTGGLTWELENLERKSINE